MKYSKSVFSKMIQLIIAAFIAKGFGFVREMVLAYYYGTSSVSDVFIAVQNIPAVIFTVFGTAVTTGFIPLYSNQKIKYGKDTADKFANNVFNIFLILSIILSWLGVIFSKQLVTIFASGFREETFNLCNHFAKIIMPTCIAIVLVYVYNAYLQIEGMFNQNSLMNVPYNLVQIVFIAIGFYLGNEYVLAIGLLLSSFSQLLYMRILIKKRTDFRHTCYINFRDDNIRQMLILVGPVFISTGVNQLNSIVDRSMASGLMEGSVSALNYSSEVSNIVTQVIILSLTTILYPKMTMLFAKDNTRGQSRFTEKYLSIVMVLVFPLTVLVFFFSEEIIQILFGRGAFTEETISFVSDALKVYAIGIIGASFRDVLNKVFYARKDTVTPMVNGIIAVMLNISLNFILVKRYAYLGLAFATSFSATICTVLLFIQLHKKMNSLDIKRILAEICKVILGLVIMIAVMLMMVIILPATHYILRCIIIGGVGTLVYGGMLLALKEEIFAELFSIIKREIYN